MPTWKWVLFTTALLAGVIAVAIWIWNVYYAKKLRARGTLLPSKKLKIPFEVEAFINYLGGLDNILSVSASANKIKVIVKKQENIDLKSLQAIKNKGIMDQTNSVTLVLGAYVGALSEQIQSELNNKNQVAK